MRIRGTVYQVVTCATMLLLAGQAAAQFGVDGSQEDMWTRPRGNTETVQVIGKILAMQRDVVRMANDESKQQWLVKMPKETAGIHLLGTARPTFLQPGMMVRFSGKFDSKGNSRAPIEKLEIFTPTPVKEGTLPDVQQFGVFPEAAFGGQLLLDAQPAGQPKGDVASFVVSGQLRGFRKGEILVAAGPTLVRTTLSEKAEILVDIADYRWVRAGDEIEVNGWCYPHLKSNVVATRVTIRTKEPLGPVVEEKSAKKPIGKPAKPGTKPGDEELPF